MAWRTLWSSTFLLVAFISYACDGMPLSRTEKTELEETLDKMNALLDKLANSFDDDSQSNQPQVPVLPVNQPEDEPEPDEPTMQEGRWEQEERSWDDKMSLREAVRYLMLLQKQKHDELPAVKRDHDIPFPFMDSGSNNRWGHQ